MVNNNNLVLRRSLFNTEEEFQQLVELQNEVYKERGIAFSSDGFKYWYAQNPRGAVVSYNAFDGNKMVAHYACIPTEMLIEGRVVKGLLSMATVTHPDYRGRGLFKTLAKMTYDYAKETGYEYVIGVANANSFPGFMKHFPFTFVSRLEVKFGYGRRISSDGEKTFSGYWTPESLNWRLAHKSCYKKKGNTIEGKHGNLLRTFMGVFDSDLLHQAQIKEAGLNVKPLLYIGLGAKIESPYFRMPKFIKHSPFNLIFMDLTDGKLPKPTKDNIFFQLLDYDVA